MKRINEEIDETITRPGMATNAQCKRVWALMAAAEMKPVWVNDISYHHAVRLLNVLERLVEALRQQKSETMR